MDAPVASFETLQRCWKHGETDSYTNTSDKAVAVPVLIQRVRSYTACIRHLVSCCSCVTRLLCVCMTLVVHSLDTHTHTQQLTQPL
jgi:hypothetical protein